MTGGASSSSLVMRADRCWTVLSFLTVLLLTSNAYSEDCFLQILVRRNTVYEAFVGQKLRVNCTVAFCNSSPLTVNWYKVDEKIVPVNMSSNIKTEWKLLEEFEGVSYLIFQNILKSDSGVYRCESEGDVSHNINISVNDGVFNGTSDDYVTKMPSQTNRPDRGPDILTYVIPAAGIISFVIIVIIISVLSLRGCKGKPSKEAGAESQYISIPMREHPALHTSPRGSPCVPQPRRSSQREAPSRSSRRGEQGAGQEEVHRGREGTAAEEEGSSIVYAALNHQQRPAARPRMVVEENSEYAAIRVA